MVLSSNASFEHRNAAILSMTAVEAQVPVTSDELDEMLAPARKRLRIPKGMLQRVAGVYERRWWKDPENGWKHGVVQAAERAIAEAGISRDQVGLLINASVSRKHLEPAMSTHIHAALGMQPSTMNFDITNACLGFVNAMTMAAGLIDAGQLDYVLVVGAEDVEEVQRRTIGRLNQRTATRDDYNNQFASLTLGSGAAAAVIGPADRHPEGHRLLHTQSRAGTEHHELCIGSMDHMQTDSTGLLENGLALVLDTWRAAKESGRDYNACDWVVIHQVSMVYSRAFSKAAGFDFDRVPLIFPDLGNIAAEAVPMTVAKHQDKFSRGDKILMMGVGSGLNTAMMEVEW
ncbi:3-oxoacyl-ACP synthase III [Helcobacillus massiliensis]|uniref:3-oxoacyl-[acyl-carrier-protein] synthase-3 n=1 Tax=Helcobacillus massiliensis TaxID=521392 RepID=A0A839QSA3_9MICO|nr:MULTISPECIES: 3-oxoacyl-ACP synthase III [Helcobacillus]MBB3022548.1 3-oxoacyl-[acyl-carrier-protein] synthase-3 [Helcobacillus massiliensis]MCT1557182.1 3-oxoacyl-ACP synthase III [Helcobacillus massiliensis]MCT2036083.1 3-oxoacyl-ACP synthase III [Helcobacillus massiliensis]MCT2331214.1 3-oxoacyl-ACP synthase III [Helcobacillus massiliensis]MDK7741251.1 3-oxoacyl-ACP synthase III [Helcobacillus massiliensis]